MKLRGREIAAFLARPDTRRAGVLIYGADAIRVGLARDDAARAVTGPEGEADMRLDRIDAAQLRSDGARLQDALRAQGFFPGPRAVVVSDAGDGLAPVISDALDGARPGEDGFLIVTAGILPARSKLRKLFETHPNAVAAPLYDDPPDRGMVEAELARAGIVAADPGALDALVALANEVDLGALRQLLGTLALYKLGDETALTAAEVAALAPAGQEAAIDAAVAAAAEGNVPAVALQMARLAAQGGNPSSICIAATRHFRQLHAASASPDGPEAALTRARPPVFGPRRDAMLRQLRGWGMVRLERVLSVLTETELSLRSSQAGPPLALVERAFIRIAMQRSAR